MSAMNGRPARFRAALGIGWVAICVAGVLYARSKNIGFTAALPVIAAFLITYPFYLAMGMREPRERYIAPRLTAALLAAGVLPYLACCFGAIEFHWVSLARVAALSFAVALWFRVLPDSPAADLAFLALIAATVITGYFDSIYPVYLGQKLTTLGHVTLIPIAVLTLMIARRVSETGLTFVPSRAEWRIGVLHYLLFLPVGAALGLMFRAFTPHAPSAWWKIAGTFLAFLWVIGLSEEFFFRGVLQQWVEDWTRNRAAALVTVSAIFGAAHVWSRLGGFAVPNWRWALIAGALGWFCGRARNQAGSIGASAVTHALAVATWRAFLG
jgi:uncharacterized protein